MIRTRRKSNHKNKNKINKSIEKILRNQDLVRQVEREYSERRLVWFASMAWSILEPQTPFDRPWYIDAICEHLEAVIRGEIRRLVINIPPRMTKSLLACVFWPAWTWTKFPHIRFLYASYAESLSRRDSRRTRAIILSSWYQRLWGNKFTLLWDQNQVLRFDNDKSGYRIATSVGGMATGEGGDIIVADDPLNTKQAISDAERERAIEWWDETMSTRLNNPSKGAKIIIMHRLHQRDPAGYVLEKGGYEHLCFPMRFESERRCYTQLKPRNSNADGPSYLWDKRTREGELLAPSRMNESTVKALETDLGTYAAAAQLQQRPSPRGGGLIKLDWFPRYRHFPSSDHVRRIIQSWDTANKGGQEHAFSVCITVFETNTARYIVDVLRRRMNIPTLERIIKSYADRWSPNIVLIEEAASGVALVQNVQQTTALPVIGIRPEKDKVTRMDAETPIIESGKVYLPERADWLSSFEAEIESFPNSTYKDQVDALSQYLKWNRSQTFQTIDWNIY
ncbi:MAG: phage terminase large subunit [Nitrosopumilaceae archaeon]|nr:phage terminase large subunit [Nitrosopumilaceae archaeon]NIU87804.1 phage terminase large subunit [Nitrosopumilaceae archaeon]NIV65186.1 phage terminase large subunit [Nitrosopumilaceae archaeon]NIX61702.1 phage terminase large subunit [Nitrosopumilaceae archaeon]